MPKNTFFNLPNHKRERIIDAAIDEFSKSHYSNVTISNIVKSAEIPKGSFYQYFYNKDDLYIYLFTGLGDMKTDIFSTLITEIETLSFKEFMTKYISKLKVLEASNQKISQLKHEFLNECPQEIKKQILKEELPKSWKLFKEVIDKYILKGEFRKDINSKTAAYVTLMSISNLEYYPLSEGENVIEVLMDTIDFLINSMES